MTSCLPPYPTSTTASPSARAASARDASTICRKWRQNASRIYFAHLRQLKFTSETDFYENGHQTDCGNVDIFAIVKALTENGFDGYLRPDHGRNIWGETGKPGYGLYDRALGAAYLAGVFEAVEKCLGKR